MQEGQKPNKEKGKKKEKQNKCAHIIEGKEQRERPNVQMLDHKKEEKSETYTHSQEEIKDGFNTRHLNETLYNMTLLT